MEVIEQRPRLVSFRAIKFTGVNEVSASPPQELKLDFSQAIEVGLGVSTVDLSKLQALVKVEISAKAVYLTGEQSGAEFLGIYEGKFEYPADITENHVQDRFVQEPYQYMLVAQVYPLAMTNFRRELQSMGLDARALPLGL